VLRFGGAFSDTAGLKKPQQAQRSSRRSMHIERIVGDT